MAFTLGLPFLVVGVVLDVLVNVTVATALMLEPPREWTVSARLSRHAGGQRGHLAQGCGAVDLRAPAGPVRPERDAL